MELKTINNLGEEIATNRLLISQLENELQVELAKNPKIAEIEHEIAGLKLDRDAKQQELLEIMAGNDLKSWKTERATFSRSVRNVVAVLPAYKKLVEDKIKSGEEVEGWEIKTTEFIAVRAIAPKK